MPNDWMLVKGVIKVHKKAAHVVAEVIAIAVPVRL
jgi:hypothetical protein